MGLLPGQGEICLVLALLSLLNQSCKLMKLQCEHAPVLGGAMVSGGWQAAPAILGFGEFPVHDISQGTSCSKHVVSEGKSALNSTQNSNNCLLCIIGALEERDGESQGSLPLPEYLRGKNLWSDDHLQRLLNALFPLFIFGNLSVAVSHQQVLSFSLSLSLILSVTLLCSISFWGYPLVSLTCLCL